jgi:transcription elongation factor B subunit 1
LRHQWRIIIIKKDENHRCHSSFDYIAIPLEIQQYTITMKHPANIDNDTTNSDAVVVEYVKLVSAEGHEFYLDRSIAMQGSQTIRTMLEGSFREAHDQVIRFPDISGYILDRVVQYLIYKAQHCHSSHRLPEFPIEPELALELLIASKYLDC